ncbi:unnamed protein product [Phytomonas sp. EM1]|nr:unnamed protein product [Phytomonas sp. EM1]|eukprot:CCW59716.1 unnamed protein product [Phytomonas sp. isolate EM1]
MNFSVLGPGELGVACALALLANHPSRTVSLLSRDGKAGGAATSAGFTRRIPPRLRIVSYPTAAEREWPHAVFLCTPAESLIAPSPSFSSTSPVRTFLRDWRDRKGDTGGGKGPFSFLAVFTRGLSTAGVTPVDLACQEMLPGGEVEGEEGERRGMPLILSATGPIFAREWAAQSNPPGSPSSSPEQGLTPDQESETRSDPPRQFSGTALVFALNHATSDAGLVSALRRHLQEDLFRREAVTLLEGPDSGAEVKLINACLPLCAFGAGLVSNYYAGSNASALAAYAQHALRATTGLINGLLGRTVDTPLPPCLCSTLCAVCSHYGLREFVLGRRFDFHFKKAFALQAVYPGQTHTAFTSTVNGLHTLMRARSVSSPFYEVIMDTFSTLLRASVVGAGLVKEGYYDYRQPGSSPFLEHAMKIDEAVFSHDEVAFEAAKSRFISTISQDPK